jgi:hypothetical protein
MQVPSKELLQNLGSIVDDPRLTAFVTWVADSLEEVQNTFETLDGADLVKHQGKALELKDILQTLTTAKSRLAKMGELKARSEVISRGSAGV